MTVVCQEAERFLLKTCFQCLFSVMLLLHLDWDHVRRQHCVFQLIGAAAGRIVRSQEW